MSATGFRGNVVGSDEVMKMKNDLSRRHRVLTPESPPVEAFDDPITAVARLS